MSKKKKRDNNACLAGLVEALKKAKEEAAAAKAKEEAEAKEKAEAEAKEAKEKEAEAKKGQGNRDTTSESTEGKMSNGEIKGSEQVASDN
jgi:septal ring factor EnvC (AmiA/AmiB activator)